MKVEKIDIKKELMDIPYGRDRMDFIERPNMSVIPVEEANFNSVITERKTYIVWKIMGVGSNEVKNYLVPVDDKNIFDDLLSIADNTFRNAVEKSWENERRRLQEATIDGIESFKHRVLTKPFLRRLLYAFTGRFYFPSYKDLLEKFN